ncbi:MAG: toll/interleukin-1 receptor domain-containing protein [Blastomonas sp.]
MAEKLFISYRRSDSQDVAARLADRLEMTPGIRSVFLDVDAIAPGETFPARLENALSESDIVLVLIGDKWLGETSADGLSRMQQPGDFVRMEVARALAMGKKVVPVLLNGIAMPDVSLLPGDVGPIVERNALFLRHHSFRQDVQIIADRLTGRDADGKTGQMMRRHPLLAMLIRLFAGIMLGLVLMLLIALGHNAMTGGRALETTLGSRALLFLLFLLVEGAAVAFVFWRAGRRRPSRS